MKVKCAFCGKEVEEDEVRFRITLAGGTLNFCYLSCLYESGPLKV